MCLSNLRAFNIGAMLRLLAAEDGTQNLHKIIKLHPDDYGPCKKPSDGSDRWCHSTDICGSQELTKRISLVSIAIQPTIRLNMIRPIQWARLLALEGREQSSISANQDMRRNTPSNGFPIHQLPGSLPSGPCRVNRGRSSRS